MAKQSVGHIIAHGHFNFANQVYLLLYKNFKRLVRVFSRQPAPKEVMERRLTAFLNFGLSNVR